MTDTNVPNNINVIPEGKVIKKRGRPRKNESLNVKTIINIDSGSETEKDEDIILHLPIPVSEDINSENKTNSENEPNKVITINNFLSTPQKDNKNTDVDTDTYFTKMDNNRLLKELKKRTDIIKKLEAKINELTSLDRQTSYHNFCLPTKRNKVDIIHNDTPSLSNATKTDIACWYCTYNFQTQPLFIVDRQNEINGKYYVFGCFCSDACALTYNNNMDDFKSRGRNCLTIKLFTELFGNDYEPCYAPQKEILEKFGGVYTIEQFRDRYNLYKNEYKMKIPPQLIHSFSNLEVSIKDN